MFALAVYFMFNNRVLFVSFVTLTPVYVCIRKTCLIFILPIDYILHVLFQNPFLFYKTHAWVINHCTVILEYALGIMRLFFS